ncbi:ABC transporter substrate-binding protein [Actinomyces sp. oral taxon 180]|uniref:ABC transporter substrate-binding protein n=1 Tax=Actinomyces sp. oral taxon 180 TaxID=651609 RepID=UPI0001F15A48|nr:ferric siderophore ABC superfamily ATP binding cassette transporter, binding protein [Actinomyces sp. oral taxon 180 str. F0310]
MHMSTRIRTFVGVALAALVAGACSPSQPTPASSTGPMSTAATETRMVTDASGQEVALPLEPTRVVTLSEPTTDNALALGITPVGAVSGRGQSGVAAYLADRADDVPILGSVGTPNLEAVGAAHPDLILVDGTSVKSDDTDTLNALKQIAPVFYTAHSGDDWRETFTRTADALGVTDEASTKLADFDAHVAAVSSRLNDGGYLDQTYSVVRWQGDSAGLILKELPAGQALSALGMKRPANQDRNGEGHSEPVSLENIDQIDADWIFFGTLGKSSVNNPSAGGATGVEASEAALAEARASVGFDSLAAVRAGHVIPVDGSLWTSTGGYLLMEGIVANIEDQFVRAS